MTVELRPLGVACNLACTYCYQEPMRLAGNKREKYDIDKMLREAESTGQPFSLFGGEALLVPKKDLEKIWKRGYELHGSNGVQTNGTLIDDDHIELFKKYNVHVGISIDGPNELNGLRVVRNKEDNEEETLKSTQTIMNNFLRLISEGVSVSVILTLHKLNATEENLPRLINFIEWLGEIGITHGNVHVLEVDETMPDQEIHVLTQEENINAYITLAEYFKENTHLQYHPFNSLKAAVEGNDESTICIWNNCDPMNTQAVYGIEANGGLSNCGRTNKEGIDFYKADDLGYERYISLYNTPQELGGCKGCRFFMLCGGSCPGEGANQDFRNKTIHCATQKAILSYYEKEIEAEGKIPFTKRKDLKDLERVMINSFHNGNATKIHSIIDLIDEHKKHMRQVLVKQ